MTDAASAAQLVLILEMMLHNCGISRTNLREVYIVLGKQKFNQLCCKCHVI